MNIRAVGMPKKCKQNGIFTNRLPVETDVLLLAGVTGSTDISPGSGRGSGGSEKHLAQPSLITGPEPRFALKTNHRNAVKGDLLCPTLFQLFQLFPLSVFFFAFCACKRSATLHARVSSSLGRKLLFSAARSASLEFQPFTFVTK